MTIHQRRANSLGAIFAATTALTAVASTAQAQTSSGKNVGLEEVIVTAQRREERQQDVPISVTGIGESQLEAQLMLNMDQLSIAVPGFSFTRNGTGPVTNYIRGIGTASTVPGHEASVATYIDGFYIPTPNTALFDFADAERIEVLKGPQGTLFGRNASGGVVQIITKQPSLTDSEGTVKLGYESFDTVKASGYYMTPLSDMFAVSLSASYNDQREGWGRNYYTGKDAQIEEYKAVRGKLLVQPTANLSFLLAADYIEDEFTKGMERQPMPGTVLPPASRAIATGFPQVGGFYDSNHDAPVGAKAELWSVYTTTTWELGAVNLINRLGYRKMRQPQRLDNDYGPADSQQFDVVRHEEILSEELQIISTTEGRLSWQAGLFYLDYQPDWLLNAYVSRGTVLAATQYPQQPVKSYSLYAQGTYELFEKTNLTLGARGTRDDRDYTFTSKTGAAAPVTTHNSTSHTEPTWRVALDHKFTPDIMGYVSYNRGYKDGVFNALAPATNPPVEPEIVDAYEIGLKTELFDHRLRLNAAAFYTEYDNQQLIINLGAQSVLTNAAASEIKGLELEGAWQATPELTISGNLNFMKGEYSSYPNASGFIPLPNGFGQTVPLNATGNDTTNTPHFSGALLVAYDKQVSFGQILASASYYYTDDRFADPANLYPQEAYDLVNLRLGWRDSGDRYGVTVYSTNLLDNEYYTSIAPSSASFTVYPGAPRIVGVSFEVDF